MKLYTKLDANLQPLADDATEFAAVHIHKTDTHVAAIEIKKGVDLNHADATKAVKALKHCGLKDWRLPDLEELEAIRDLKRYHPAVDPSFFPFIKSEWYWTRTDFAGNPECAWVVGFHLGHSSWGGRHYGYRALAVRSASQS